MAIYLAEHEVGFDAHLVGYPNLGDCMAVALHTANGLFGFHVPPGTTDKTRGFSAFIKGRAHAGNPIALYGSCRFLNRYNTNMPSMWIQEMRYIAALLGFRGRITGFNMTSPGTGIINDATPAYLQYKLKPPGVNPQLFIKYAQMAELQETRGPVPTGNTDIRVVRPPMKTGYELRVPYSAIVGHSNVTTAITKNIGVSLNLANTDSGFYSFLI